MTFLNPANLWFLSFLIIPIAFHLLNLLKNKKEDFSSLILIKELKQTSMRNVKLKKLILLLLRILGIIFLVISFSKPVTNGFLHNWSVPEIDSRLYIVIDNSASMGAKNKGKTFLERSKHEASSLIPEFKKNALISIFQTCPPKMIFEGYSDDINIKKAIKSVKQTESFDNIWNTTGSFINRNKINEKLKECILFSDLMHPTDSLFSKSINNFIDWKFYFIQPEIIEENLSIKNMSFVNRVNTLQQLSKVNTRVQNKSVSPRKNIPLELLFNNQRVGQVISEFSSNIEKEFQFQAYPIAEGILQSKAIIPIDSYLSDNSWYHTVPVMRQINCGIIGKSREEVQILEVILKSIDPNKEFLNIESRIQPSLNRLFLDEFDMVIIYNCSGLTKQSVKDLDNFTKEGGGLIWFEGETSELPNHESLYELLNFPRSTDTINSGQGFFSTEISTEESDLLQNIRVKDINKELPKVFKYIKTETNKDHMIHWNLNNMDPFLIEFSNGGGDIFYFSSILNLEWNDLSIRGLIIPLMYKLLILAGTDEMNTSSIFVDDVKWISLQESKLKNIWEVLSPSGQKEMIVPDYDLEGIQITMTNELGIYEVFSNGEQITSFPTKLHNLEYLTNHLNQDDINKFIPKDQFRIIPMDKNTSSSFAEIRHGKSLWKFFLYASIFIFLIETIVGLPNKKNLNKI